MSAARAAQREACAARPIPASVQRQREDALTGAIAGAMDELNERPLIITLHTETPGRVEA